MKPSKQNIPSQESVNDSVESGGPEEEIESTSDSDSSNTSSFMPKLRATAAKRGVKVAVGLIGAFYTGYKMFFSNTPTAPTQDQVEQGAIVVKPKIETSKDFANKDIPLDRKPTGTIAKKIDTIHTDKMEEADRHIEIKQKEVKLDAPELPPLPNLGDEDPSRGDLKPLSIGSIAKKKHLEAPAAKIGGGTENPDGTVTPNPTQPFNPQNVTSNGIPIVNSNDLSLEQKRQLTMFVMKGSGPSGGLDNKIKKDKSNLIIVEGSALSVKKTGDKTTAERVVNLDTTLIQGKMLDGVLETAINSQLPGTIRGIITTDVYGETGEKVLIPRGSRVYGSYSATVTRGQSRISVSWNRLIRPDGISITVNAKATDQFGRAGLEGDVDNRFGDTLTNSLLVTFATLGAALALNQVAGSSASQSQTINPSGTFTTSNINPVSVAAQSAIQSMQQLTNTMTQGSTNLPPIITLPQGTKIKLMVAQDIVIPPFQKAHLS